MLILEVHILTFTDLVMKPLPVVGEVTSVMTVKEEKNPGLLDQLVTKLTRSYQNFGEAIQPLTTFVICKNVLHKMHLGLSGFQ